MFDFKGLFGAKGKLKEMSKNVQMIVGGLGRPFTLGMLYNAPKDELIPGLSVLDSKTLQSLTVNQPQRSSHFDISASDSTKDSSFNLNVDASLKLSFMSGLIEVGGSANYLNNKKESKNQCRVTLQYQATTHFEQLSLTAEVCEKIKSSEIIEKGLATHVVTGIEYGAKAFFVFDSQKVESSNVQTVKGQMEVTIKKIPEVEIHGEAKVELTDEEKELVKTFSVKFYGDFLLKKNPASFEAAVQTYVALPKLLMGADGKEPVKTVPLKVWLLPLEVFTLKPAPVTKGISEGLVLEAEDTLEELDSITMRCNDCLSVSAVGKFPQLQQPLHKFYKLCNYYSVELQRQMAETCPAIREGKVSKSVLRGLFEKRDTSPFSQDKLTKWLQDKEREVNVVQACLDIMHKVPVQEKKEEKEVPVQEKKEEKKEVPVQEKKEEKKEKKEVPVQEKKEEKEVPVQEKKEEKEEEAVPVLSTQAELDKVVLAPGGEERWGFVFTSLETTDSQLEEMSKYLKALKTGASYEPRELQSAADPWFNNNEVVKKMRQKAADFKKYSDDGGTAFITAFNDMQSTGCATYTYQNGVREGFSQS